MEVKAFWPYDEFPELKTIPKGANILAPTGEEVGVRQLYNVEYARVDGKALHLQILYPVTRNQEVHEDFPSYPCVAFVQGSAWMEQEIFQQLPMISRLAERGYVVAIVEYRHSGIAQFPAQAIDAKNAIRFLRVHAEDYHIDPHKMVLAGDSSGGHTAMAAGILHNDESSDSLFAGVSAEVSCIINYYGSTSVMRADSNPTTVNHCMPESPEGLVMGGVNLLERPELMKKLSIEENISTDTQIAPVLMFHGTKDRTVNAEGSVLLYNKLKECGKEVDFYLIQGADHGGPDFWTSQVLDIVDSFIRKHIG